MLKGDVFAEQLFENQIFALFIDTFLNGNCGVASNYKNSMALTYSGGNITIDSGAVCIKGRFLEESTSTTIAVGETNKFHSLVIEIDLDKTNTASNFEQGYYKILSAPYSYPTLTQTDIVKNVSGVYQYELAQFKTNASGNVTDFVDKRTFLDIESIYDAIEASTTTLLNSIDTDADALIAQLRTELQQARDNSLYVLKSDMYYSNNEAYQIKSRNIYSGFITDNAEMIRFLIPLPKKVPNDMVANITKLKLTIRGINGYITTLGQDVLQAIQERYIVEGDKLVITIGQPGGWNNATNNTPVVININADNDVIISFYI